MDAFERAAALTRCAVLARVPPAALLALAERAGAVRVGAGEPLPVRSDAGDAVLVIARGRARAADAELAAGALVGELGALDDEATPVEAVALEETVAVRVWRDDFLDLLAEHPAAVRALARDLAARIRR